MKNGRIHFHFILDCYVSNRDVQQTWNVIQRDNDYLDNFFARFNRWNAPSTHMESISTVDATIDYVLKYAMKSTQAVDDDNQAVSGLMWGCSDALKTLKPYSVVEHSDLISAVNKLIEHDCVEVFEAEQFMILKGDIIGQLRVIDKRLVTAYEQYYVNLYDRMYNPNIVQDTLISSDIGVVVPIIPQVVQLQLPFDLNLQYSCQS